MLLRRHRHVTRSCMKGARVLHAHTHAHRSLQAVHQVKLAWMENALTNAQ